MSLDNFFRINLPYGMKKQPDQTWFVFNEEYAPIGWNTKQYNESLGSTSKIYTEYPISTKYKGLTDLIIETIIKDKDLIVYNEKGEITSFCFYDDRSNPLNNGGYWDHYFDKIKALAAFEVNNW